MFVETLHATSLQTYSKLLCIFLIIGLNPKSALRNPKSKWAKALGGEGKLLSTT